MDWHTKDERFYISMGNFWTYEEEKLCIKICQLAAGLLITYNLLLSEHWILDVDTTIKPLYGKQEGAVVGYNPRKPGRPSHVYHLYMIANIRLTLDVEVASRKHSANKYIALGLWFFIEGLEKNRWPEFIRGDCSFGTDEIITKAEAIKLPCL